MKKILLIILSLFILLGTVKALEITILGNNNGGNWYKFDTLNKNNIFVLLEDKLSDSYNDGSRVTIVQNYDNGNNGHDSYSYTGILESELYGDFYLKDGRIKLNYNSSLMSSCDNNVAYSYSGLLFSPSFGDFNIQNGSYYCPLSGSSNLILESDLLGQITISGSNIIETIKVENSRGEEVDIGNNIIFDDKKISITGAHNLKNSSGLDSEYSANNSVETNYSVSGKMADFNRSINKNLVKYTNGIDSVDTNNNSLNGFSKKIHYYDFEGQEGDEINYNKGLILHVGPGTGGDTFNQMGVAGQKVLYVKGGNIYINSDISNNSKASQLVIVVKRDSTNKQNGGNVYINPDVTNIDATIIADGSIISFDGTNILNAEDNTNGLRKQLLIYGSISTKNTFGEDKSVYGTDDYINNGGENNTIGTYNLAKLRSFQTILNEDISVGNCVYNGSDKKIVAKGNSGNSSIKYAFAGKKECYLGGDLFNTLRGTEKTSPLVIEYNPIIQINPHFILQN